MQGSSDIDRAQVVDQNFIRYVKKNELPQEKSAQKPQEVGLTRDDFLDLFDSQLKSRHLDLISRELKQQNLTYYTIGSSGHEGNAAIAKVFRHTDIAFLHYRSGAFVLQRAKSLTEINCVRDLLYSFMAAKKDPIANGRHKVFGSVPLFIPPQTSTIASHLPKAVGCSASIKHAQSLKIDSKLKSDSVVLCSFGDASVNHSTALGAFNSAQWLAHNHYPLPLVFICEDNGLGISVPTPKDWIESTIGNQPWLHYIQADGLNLANVYQAACEAEHVARVERKPVFLHMKCVRLLGHAGSDVEIQYRLREEIEADEFNDPLLHSARIALEENFLSINEIITKYQRVKEVIHNEAKAIKGSEQLASRKEVMSSIIPPARDVVFPNTVSEQTRKATMGVKYEKLNTKIILSQQINFALMDLLLQYPNLIVFGEDVGKKGGVYRVSADLQQQLGQARVFDTLLDEQSILGYAIGHAHNNFIPIAEIQFLAYLHNAIDQLRGEAATLSFFSNGQYTNPMIVRIAGLAYQKGFGGHFHNDNSLAALRDIPGIIIACPSRGDDAAMMLRTAVELCYKYQRIVVFLEPIALYMTKDLHSKGDGLWLFSYPDTHQKIAFGEIGIYGDDKELAIISYGNGHYLSQQAAKILKDTFQISCKVIDLRWLAPLNEDAILKAVSGCRQILIVDECRKTGSLSEQLNQLFIEKLHPLPHIKNITGADSFISLGKSWQYLLPTCEEIVAAALSVASK